MKEQIQKRAAETGLRSIWSLPFQAEKVLADMHATADVGLVMLLPEAGEHSVPSKLLGYLAAGRPVIASVHDGSPTAQTLRLGRCGIVVPPQDPAAMAEAIGHAADHRQEIAEMGRNARHHFLQSYDRSSSIRLWQEGLTSLVQRGSLG